MLMCSACVTQGTYDKLKAEQDETQDQLQQKNAALEACNQKQTQNETKIRDLQAALADETEKVNDGNARIARCTAEMASASKDKKALQGSIDEMTVALADLEKRRSEAEKRVQEFKNLLSKFKSLIDAGKLKVRIVDGRMVVVLATDILFGSGSASLSKDGKAAIGEVSQVLASIPKRTFQVEGHTDDVPIATAQYPSNWELASARSINVVKAMIEAGMPPERISGASFGQFKPAVPNDSKENKAQNRRIEIIIVPDLSTLPGFDELQKAEKNG
ncbi:MAG: OmpA family protein [Myxococcaceae bacterium]